MPTEKEEEQKKSVGGGRGGGALSGIQEGESAQGREGGSLLCLRKGEVKALCGKQEREGGEREYRMPMEVPSSSLLG